MENIKAIKAMYNLNDKVELQFYLMHLSHLRTLRHLRSTDDVLMRAQEVIKNSKNNNL